VSPYRLLGLSRVYSAFADLAGGRAREIYAREYIRAKGGDRILDIGCGPGDILAYLPVDVRYAGFDADAGYIEAARARFGARGEFMCRKITPDLLREFSGFDLVLANGVLHHLDDSDARTLFGLARAALAAGGRLVTLDGCYVESQSALARYLLRADRGKFVRDQLGYTALARSVFPSVEAHIRQDLMRIPYTHIILECRP
jgi:SAM-dependent methyltransferase